LLAYSHRAVSTRSPGWKDSSSAPNAHCHADVALCVMAISEASQCKREANAVYGSANAAASSSVVSYPPAMASRWRYATCASSTARGG
jgi:hypothetical protein